MKKFLNSKLPSTALKLLFFEVLEMLYQAGRILVKWFLMAMIMGIKVTVFTVLLPYSLFKCAARTVRHRSFDAGAQLAKWIWIDYWKTRTK